MDTTSLHDLSAPARARDRRRLAPASGHVGRAPLLRSGLGREAISFAIIGVASTAAYAVLYLAARSLTGPAAANAAALVITAVANTAANRRLTFGVRDRHTMLHDQAVGLAALGVALAITTASVHVMVALVPQAGRLLELAVLVLASALATVARFVLLRTMIGARRPTSTPATAGNRSPS